MLVFGTEVVQAQGYMPAKLQLSRFNITIRVGGGPELFVSFRKVVRSLPFLVLWIARRLHRTCVKFQRSGINIGVRGEFLVLRVFPILTSSQVPNSLQFSIYSYVYLNKQTNQPL